MLYVDVSHHDRARHGGPLDWERIRGQTSPVMMARATYGDPRGFSPQTHYFAEFQRGARAAGFELCGGYHNLVRGDASSIARQVDWLRSQLDALRCEWAMVDVEPYRELVSNGLWPRWDDVLRWRDRWHAVESRPCAWYIPRWFWSEFRKGPNLGSPDLTQLPGLLIQSNYPGGDGTAAEIYAAAGGDRGTGWDDLYGGRTPDIWQFTSNGNVAGASSQTCVNAFRGTVEELAALLKGDDEMSEWSQPDPLGTDPDGNRRTPGQRDRDLYAALYFGRRPVDEHGRAVGPEAWIVSMLQAIAKTAGVDETELAAITQAARAGAEQGAVAAADELAAAIVAELPDGPMLSRADVEAAVASVLGSARITVPEGS